MIKDDVYLIYTINPFRFVGVCFDKDRLDFIIRAYHKIGSKNYRIVKASKAAQVFSAVDEHTSDLFDVFGEEPF